MLESLKLLDWNEIKLLMLFNPNLFIKHTFIDVWRTFQSVTSKSCTVSTVNVGIK